MSTLNQFVGIAQTICPSSATVTFKRNDVSSITFDKSAPLGSRPNLACGFLLCKTGGNTAWIVAPRCAEVGRTWYCREDAVTLAINCTGCNGGWFVPTCAQLQNPGYTCRTYWDSFSSTGYWSSTEGTATGAWIVTFSTGNTGIYTKTSVVCVRAFRCVTY